MGAKHLNQKTVTKLETSEVVKITGHEKLLQETETFDQKLYQSDHDGTHQRRVDFVLSVQQPKGRINYHKMQSDLKSLQSREMPR